MRDVAALLPRVVGPFDRHCCGCPFQPDAAYVTTPLIGLGAIRAGTDFEEGSPLVARTLAFDRAEGEWANLTQTNMVTVSSFNGVRGLLLGYDLLRQPLAPLVACPCAYDAAPLFAAARALYGTVREPRFPLLPGQHLLCACKAYYGQGPGLLYGALAVGIAGDRAANADLFLEDAGLVSGVAPDDGSERERQEAGVLRRLVDAVGAVGENLGVRYACCLVGLRAHHLAEGEVGCALVAAPYVHLARRAVPDGDPLRLAGMSCAEWEVAVRPGFPTPSVPAAA